MYAADFLFCKFSHKMYLSYHMTLHFTLCLDFRHMQTHWIGLPQSCQGEEGTKSLYYKNVMVEGVACFFVVNNTAMVWLIFACLCTRDFKKHKSKTKSSWKERPKSPLRHIDVQFLYRTLGFSWLAGVTSGWRFVSKTHYMQKISYAKSE